MQSSQKKRKLNSGISTSHTICCSCLEEDSPHLMFIGCSNRHTMCHLCSRMFFSNTIVMNKFPNNFPGKINIRKTMECPICKEILNGVSNIFVFGPEQKQDNNNNTTSIKYFCPYRNTVTEPFSSSCPEQKWNIHDLQKHLLCHHNRSVRCPNCLVWIKDDNKSLEDSLLMHVFRECSEVRCIGCNRESNMISMYMHSLIGRDNNVCDSTSQLFSAFGTHLNSCFLQFKEVENMAVLSGSMLQWTAQYLFVRMKQNETKTSFDGDGGYKYYSQEFQNQFDRIYHKLIFYIFNIFHKDLHTDIKENGNTPLEEITDLILRKDANDNDSENIENNYNDFMLICTSAFAHQVNIRLDQISQLPFVYRLVMMTLSEFKHAHQIFQRCPPHITTREQQDIKKLALIFKALAFDSIESLDQNLNRNESDSDAIVVVDLLL